MRMLDQIKRGRHKGEKRTKLRQGHSLIYVFLNEDLAAVLSTNNWWCLRVLSMSEQSERGIERESERGRKKEGDQ